MMLSLTCVDKKELLMIQLAACTMTHQPGATRSAATWVTMCALHSL